MEAIDEAENIILYEKHNALEIGIQNLQGLQRSEVSPERVRGAASQFLESRRVSEVECALGSKIADKPPE